MFITGRHVDALLAGVSDARRLRLAARIIAENVGPRLRTLRVVRRGTCVVSGHNEEAETAAQNLLDRTTR